MVFWGFFQVFPPQFRELPAPNLDLFDLDEQFSSEKVRLAQQTNKCKYLHSVFLSTKNEGLGDYMV